MQLGHAIPQNWELEHHAGHRPGGAKAMPKPVGDASPQRTLTLRFSKSLCAKRPSGSNLCQTQARTAPCSPIETQRKHGPLSKTKPEVFRGYVDRATSLAEFEIYLDSPSVIPPWHAFRGGQKMWSHCRPGPQCGSATVGARTWQELP